MVTNEFAWPGPTTFDIARTLVSFLGLKCNESSYWAIHLLELFIDELLDSSLHSHGFVKSAISYKVTSLLEQSDHLCVSESKTYIGDLNLPNVFR